MSDRRRWNRIDDEHGKSGKVLWVCCLAVPEYGVQLMWWNKDKSRWSAIRFAPMRSVEVWWDEQIEQPTHWMECESNARPMHVSLCKEDCQEDEQP